jgi:(1->4)-alpha-D-glucan 1-alpha-D-glucosylmutase
MAGPRIPISTYRLQFNQQLRFSDVTALIPYLHRLGVTDIYASPLLQAKRGSTHGYDVTDPSHLNSELGSNEEFDAMVLELQSHGMGLLLDIVPNHMAASDENPWWMDLLEDGPRSAFASHFDVDWHPPSRSLENRVLLPILGKPYAQVIEGRKLLLTYAQTGFFLNYFDFLLPVAVRSYGGILGHRQDRLERTLRPDSPALQEFHGILAAVAQIPSPTSAPLEAAGERRQHREAIKERLWRLYSDAPEVKRFVDGNVRLFNGKTGVPSTFLLMDQLLAEQAYELAFWRTANEEINYRRFFTISDLVGVRVEDPVTFEAEHSVVLRLAGKGMVTGFRIDHIDGLRDPLGYLRRLQERLHAGESNTRPKDFYVVVEKILSEGETLPAEWPVHGTSGYDFLNALNGLFVDASNLPVLEDAYSRFIGERIYYPDLAYRKKKQVMESLLSVEMRTLGRYLGVLAEQDRYARELSREQLTQALVETTACLTAYRTYIRGFEIKTQEKLAIEKAVREAQRRNPATDPNCFRFLLEVLLLEPGSHLLPEQRESRLAFVMSWQQFTGPITAKGVEDSALYVYNRLVSLNEVGGAADCAGVSMSKFHEFVRQRRKQWPFALNATMTHDAKHAEDVRARINVLSELPAEWESCLNNWSRWNDSKCRVVKGIRAPERNEETLLYQILIGSWTRWDLNCACYTRRIQDFMVKAVREAMVHTRWTVPNVDHEKALIDFVAAILEDTPENRFLPDFIRFANKIAHHGALNGLAQLLIKIASPGVADFYQGTELWDFRLVDPDNRRSVDFAKRNELLADLCKGSHSLSELVDHWQDGRIKMYVMQKSLQFRRDHSSLVLRGDYIPLAAEGPKQDCVVAFGRRYRGDWSVLIVPRFTTRLVDESCSPTGTTVWGETRVVLPKGSPKRWVNVFDDEGLDASAGGSGNYLPLGDVLRRFPVALLARARITASTPRQAALNRITAPPSKFA